ncbi:MAG: hypothetical protein HOV80_31835 [Polyangiaceae bacterium]|nr:hypothetical protein [Polyangiaceae bacterium]
MLRLSLAVGCTLLSFATGCEGTVSDDAEGGSGGADGTTGTGSPTSATGMSTSATTPTTSTTSTGSPTSTTTGATTTGSGGDPYAAERTACINKINELRATKGLPAYGQWTSAETCSDQQASADEMSGTPHGAFGMCGESGQNECLGAGPQGIEGCLDSMWAEKDQPGCAGCDACNMGYDPNCPNCDFYGSTTGDVCGHYVNMSALYFSEAACGFSSLGGWDVINFH